MHHKALMAAHDGNSSRKTMENIPGEGKKGIDAEYMR
jgi:hypothetical protein